MRSLQSLNLQPVLSTEGMRNLDAASKGFLAKKTASDPSENDVIQSGYTLMQEAGLALFKFMQSKALAPIAIFIGSGNNGGDGLVLAKLLLQGGIQSTVFSLAPESKFKNEAKLALDDFLQAGGSLFDFKKIIEEPKQASLLLHDGFKLIVDCMLGNGAKGELRPEFATAVETINGSGLPVIAADAPTGYDSGAHIRNNICIHANETMLFGFPRLDAYTKEGGPAFGKAVVAPLSYPDKVVLQFDEKNYLVTKDEKLLKIVCDYADCIERAERYARKQNIRLFTVHPLNRRVRSKSAQLIADADPREFVWLIEHADAVFTNSFHATSFSAIFEKKLMYLHQKELGERAADLLGTVRVTPADDDLVTVSCENSTGFTERKAISTEFIDSVFRAAKERENN